MTKAEEKELQRIYEILKTMSKENESFKTTVAEQVAKIDRKVEIQYTPVNMEKSILKASQEAVYGSIIKALGDYNSPLTKLVAVVINENTTFLKEMISDAFNSVIRTEDFKKSIVDGFSHKVARTIVSNNEGLFDKVSNDLKQDNVFKSKMTLAVANVVNECLTERSK